MGIPAFYKWLTTRYEKTVVSAVEETPLTVSGVTVPLRTTNPNPNGVEYDNLYLDMNNIIHPCFHAENLPAPSSYEEVFEGVFKYVDKIFSIIRPRKLLYMAIDGVAPRAKMNQQRSRRFRAAKDAADEAQNLGKSSSLELEGGAEQERCSKKMDSNVITPGTEFMDLLSRALRYYIRLRMNNDPGWQRIKVILSDATVPGEGEHKIMSYIRLQRNLPGYDPNTRHCLYGLDADLIMLALATHEVHFTILREDVQKVNQESKKKRFKMQRNRKRKPGQQKHNQGLSGTEKASDMLDRHISGLKFQLLNIWVLREYLAHDMRAPNSTVESELERLIDDFVFICLFVGNDFLPHIPSLEISEGAIDLLMAVYKKEFFQMGGYLTNSFEIDLSRLEHFIQAVGSHENAIFRKRDHMQKVQGAHSKDFSVRQNGLKLSKLPLGDSGILPESHELSKPSHATARSFGEEQHGLHSDIDLVRLGEEGWKERYYAEKFDAENKDEQERARRHAVMKYMEGIAWVMRYYYEGVCSWDWFYPYHYAPFASDFCGLGQLEIKFSLGKPFKPFDQLMAVLPAASAHALPSLYRELMTDPSSPLLDFYPSDIEIDMNGKRFSWQAICKLPFIEESRLLSEIAKVEHTLTEDERFRNSWGLDTLFVHIVHPLAAIIVAFLGEHNDVESLDSEVSITIDPETSGGMNGYIIVTNGTLQPPEIYSPIAGMETIEGNKVLTVLYELPHFHPHVPRLPQGVIFPDKLLKKQEMPHEHSLWHEMRSHHHISSRMPIKNAISGSRLARCAHILISKVIPPKQQDQRGLFRPSYSSGKSGVAELKTRTSVGLSKTMSSNGRSKGGNDHEDAVPNKGFNPGELEGRCVDPDGYTLNGMTAEKKSEITKKRKKRRVEDNNNVQGLEGIVLEENTLSPLYLTSCGLKEEDAVPNKGFNPGELEGRCVDPDGYTLNGMTAEKKSEITKKRKKRRVEDNNNVQGLEGIVLEENTLSPLYLTSCGLKEEDAVPNKGFNPGELEGRCVDPDGYTLNGMTAEKKSEITKKRRVEDNNNVQGLEGIVLEENTLSPLYLTSCGLKEEDAVPNKGFNPGELEGRCVDPDGYTLNGMTAEKKSEITKKRRVEDNNNVQGLEGIVLEEITLSPLYLTSCDLKEEKASADCELLVPSNKALEAKIDEKPERKHKRRRVEENNIAPSGTQRTESCVTGENRQPAFGETKITRGVKKKRDTLKNNIAPSGTQRTESCVAGENIQTAFGEKKKKRGVKRKRGTLKNNIAHSGTQNTKSCADGEDIQHNLAQGAPDKVVEAKIDEKPTNAQSGSRNTVSCADGEDIQDVLGQGAPDKAAEAKIDEKPKNSQSGTQITESCATGEDRQSAFAHMELKTEGKTKKTKRGRKRRGSVNNNIAHGGTQNTESCADGEDIEHVLAQGAPDTAVEAKIDENPKNAHCDTQRTESCATGEDGQLAFAHMELKTEGKTKKTKRGKRRRGTVNNNIPHSGTRNTESCADGEDIYVLAQAAPDEVECSTSSVFVEPNTE